MNLRNTPLRKFVTGAASASILAASFITVSTSAVAPAALNAGTVCVQEDGSTTVYPSILAAQNAYQGAVAVPQPAWPTGQKLGCDVVLRPTGSGTGRTNLVNWLKGTSSDRRDLAASSSSVSESELMSFQIGGDGMVIAVRDDNPMTQIKMGEVTAIYNGNVTTWQQLPNANGKTGTIVPRARIPGSGTRDDMKAKFKQDNGTTQSSPPYAKISCSSGYSTCEPNVIDSTGLPRLTTSQEEANAVCDSVNAIAYTSLANLKTYGPGTAGCGGGHTLKALALQSCSYTGFTGSTDPLALTCSGPYVAPTVTSAAIGGSYPAKRQLFLATGTVPTLVSKYGTGNGTGWTDDLGTTKAFDNINYMSSAEGQAFVRAVGFIDIDVPSKQRIPDADIDLNGGIGLTDIGQITGRWNRVNTILGTVRADVDNNGGVGLSDIGKITGQWGNPGFGS